MYEPTYDELKQFFVDSIHKKDLFYDERFLWEGDGSQWKIDHFFTNNNN